LLAIEIVIEPIAGVAVELAAVVASELWIETMDSSAAVAV
jgi:hypothetical protein